MHNAQKQNSVCGPPALLLSTGTNAHVILRQTTRTSGHYPPKVPANTEGLVARTRHWVHPPLHPLVAAVLPPAPPTLAEAAVTVQFAMLSSRLAFLLDHRWAAAKAVGAK